MDIRKFVTTWGFDVDDSDLKKLEDGVSRVEKGLRSASKSMTRLGRNLSIGLTLPIVGLGAATIKAASDAEETASKFRTVFKDISDESNQAAKSLAEDFGLSQTASQKLLGDTGDLLTGFGFAQKTALDLSSSVNELAVDLASFTNFSGGAEGASKALTKALLGERESIKSLGISILEEDVKKQVQIDRAKGLTFATERQAKAFATLTLAQKQSKNAIGDFARTSQSFANQSRILRGRLNDLAVSFGEILLPVATKIVTALGKMISFFNDLSPEVKRTIIIVAGLAAAIGPLLVSAGLLIGSLLALKAGFAAVGIVGLKSFAALALPFLKIVAIGVLIGIVVEDIIGYFQGRDSVTGLIIEGFDFAIDYVAKKFMTLPGIVKQVVAGILTPFRLVISTVRGVAGAIGALAGGSPSLAVEAIKGIALDAISPSTADSKSLSLGESLGFGRPTPSAQALSSSNTSNTNQSINAPINITVPEGTSADQVGPAVQKGVKEGIADLLRQTQRQTTGAVVN